MYKMCRITSRITFTAVINPFMVPAVIVCNHDAYYGHRLIAICPVSLFNDELNGW